MSELMEQINERLRQDMKDFEAENGRAMNSKDPEFWDSSDRYRAEVTEKIIEPRKAAEAAQAKAERKEAEFDAANPKPTERVCVTPDCGNIIQPTGKRGRPAKKCASCRGV